MKSDRLQALNKRIDTILDPPYSHQAKLLLWQFVKVFKIKKHYEQETNWIKKAWYLLVGIPLAVDGFIRDVQLNSVLGPRLFPKSYVKFGPLTSTLNRVLKSEPNTASTRIHRKYGVIKNGQYLMAVQICEVLNDYDPNHCGEQHGIH